MWVVPAFTQVGQASNPSSDRAGSLIEAGQAFLQKRDYVNALKQLEAVKPLLEQSADEFRLGRLLKQIGDLYAARNYYRQSAENYRDAIPLLRKTEQTELVGACLESLAGVSASFGYSTQAIGHYARALAIKSRLNDSKGVLHCHQMLSKLYFSEKNYADALSHNQEVQLLAGDDWATQLFEVELRR